MLTLFLGGSSKPFSLRRFVLRGAHQGGSDIRVVVTRAPLRGYSVTDGVARIATSGKYLKTTSDYSAREAGQ